jgi:predicted AAA+ superfamily ATPase
MVDSTLQTRLQSHYDSQYRRIWVQYTRLSKRRSEYRIVLTLFPHDGEYFFLFSDVVNQIDFNTCSNLIENNLHN